MAVLFPKKVPVFSRALGESDDVFDFDSKFLCEPTISVPYTSEFGPGITTLLIGVGVAQCEILEEIINQSKAEKIKVVEFCVSGRCILTCSAFVVDSLAIWMCRTLQHDACYGSMKWAETVFAPFSQNKIAQIYILGNLPASEYHSDSKPTPPFLRSLRTPRASASCFTTSVKVLETPNIVSGFTAALMCYCIYKSLPACTFISYCENSRHSPIVSDIASIIVPVLRAIPELQPLLLPQCIATKSVSQTFDQMYT